MSDITNTLILNKKELAEKFSERVLVLMEKNTSLVEAIIHLCEKENIDIEVAASYIKMNQNLKAKIKDEFEELNFLPKTSRLPI